MNLMTDLFKNHITRIKCLVIWFLFFCNCSAIKHSTKDGEIFLLILSLPVVQLDGGLINIRDSIVVTHYKNSILYQFPNHYSIEDEEKILFQELRYTYFAFKANEKSGYLFSSINDTVGKKLSVDSLLQRKAFGSINLYDVVRESELISSTNDSANGIITQIYLSQKVPDESYNDSTYLFFLKKHRKIDFPFSKKLDSAMNLGLIKAKLIFKERYSNSYKIKAPKREMSIEIQDLKYKDVTEFISFFNIVNSKYSNSTMR